jgi:hypothetical protein
VGSVITSWVEGSPGVWQQQFGPWGLRVLAVPEPSTVSLVVVSACWLIGGRRGWQAILLRRRRA